MCVYFVMAMFHTTHTVLFYLAFGIVLWELTSQGKSPYPDVELSQVFKVLEDGYRLECPVGCPRNIYSMMKKCKFIKFIVCMFLL